jgi:hypothetical protein
VKSEVEKKLKTALDESRLLILGAQVLFGFLFQGVFQEAFEKLPFGVQLVQCFGLLSISLAVSLLMAPSLHRQIAFKGESVPRAITNASRFAGFSLLPLTVGIGLAPQSYLSPSKAKHCADGCRRCAAGHAGSLVRFTRVHWRRRN